MSKELTVYSNPGDLKRFLETGKGVIAAALPRHLNPDRMLRLAITAFSTTPKLRQCTGQSILGSIVVASQLGLEPGVAGQGYLIPYKETCTFVPGWQGLVSLLNNSGRATAWTGAVFEGDEFDFQLGSSPRCVHIPGPNFGDPDKMVWVYACGKVNGSEQPVIEAWPMARVWRHRDRFNKVGKEHYSYKHPEMYARKVVLLQVLKYMPRSIELNNAIVAANAAEEGRTSRVEDGVVIDVESNPIPEGRIGNRSEKSLTPTEAAAAEKKQAADKPAETTTPPAADDHPFRTDTSGVTPGVAQADAQSEAGERAAAREREARAKGPTKKELLKQIMEKAKAMNFGGAVFTDRMREIGYLPPTRNLDELDEKMLAQLLDGWDEIEAQLTKKEG